MNSTVVNPTWKPWGVAPHLAEIKAIQITPQMIRVNQPVVDMRPIIDRLGLMVRSQFGGTCAIFATTFLLEYIYRSRLLSDIQDLSEEYLKYVTFTLEQVQVQGGDNFGALNTGYQKWGVCPEALVPGSSDPVDSVASEILATGKRWAKLIPDFIKTWDNSRGATDTELQKILSYLDQNVPVAAGLLWPKQWSTQTIQGVDLMAVPVAANKWDVVVDGHAIDLVGYGHHASFPGGGYFIFRNSWGVEFGDQGYGYMPFEYVVRYANDLLAFKPTGFNLGLGALKTAPWVHGTITRPEALDRLNAADYRGWGSAFHGKPSTTNWFHIPITAPMVEDTTRPVLGKVFVLFETGGTAQITNLHIYDGKNRIRSFDGLTLTGQHRNGIDSANCFYVTPPTNIYYGLGLSVGVDFGTGADSWISFASAGADFHTA